MLKWARFHLERRESEILHSVKWNYVPTKCGTREPWAWQKSVKDMAHELMPTMSGNKDRFVAVDVTGALQCPFILTARDLTGAPLLSHFSKHERKLGNTKGSYTKSVYPSKSTKRDSGPQKYSGKSGKCEADSSESFAATTVKIPSRLPFGQD